jgi:hypothetical protein
MLAGGAECALTIQRNAFTCHRLSQAAWKGERLPEAQLRPPGLSPRSQSIEQCALSQPRFRLRNVAPRVPPHPSLQAHAPHRRELLRRPPRCRNRTGASPGKCSKGVGVALQRKRPRQRGQADRASHDPHGTQCERHNRRFDVWFPGRSVRGERCRSGCPERS